MAYDACRIGEHIYTSHDWHARKKKKNKWERDQIFTRMREMGKFTRSMSSKMLVLLYLKRDPLRLIHIQEGRRTKLRIQRSAFPIVYNGCRKGGREHTCNAALNSMWHLHISSGREVRSKRFMIRHLQVVMRMKIFLRKLEWMYMGFSYSIFFIYTSRWTVEV